MNLQQRITAILQKLNDPDTISTAEREIKNLIVNEIDDGEKLSVLIGCIGDERDAMAQKNRKGRYNQLKFYIAIAEIFQHQILEFLPKIFSVLNKKVKDGDLEIAEIIADTYGGITEYAYRGAEEQDSNFVFSESFNSLAEIIEKGGKAVQTIGGMCLTKIVQNCAIEILKAHFESAFDSLERLLSAANMKAPFHIFECILSLILSLQEKVGYAAPSLPPLLVKFILDEDFRTRKMCIDIFYSILMINKGLLAEIEGNIYEMLQSCKSDKNKAVREAAVECLKLVKPNPISKEMARPRPEAKNAKKPSAFHEAQPQNPIRPKMVSNKKLPFVNKKIDLEHVHSTIDKANINRNFLKQGQSQDDTVVLFKEPRIQIDSYRPENSPLHRRPEGSSRRNPNTILEEIPPEQKANDNQKDINQDFNSLPSENNAFTFNQHNARPKENSIQALIENPNRNFVAQPLSNNFTERQANELLPKSVPKSESPFQQDLPYRNENFTQATPFSNRPNVAITAEAQAFNNWQQGFSNQKGSELNELKMQLSGWTTKFADMQTVIMNLQVTNSQLANRLFTTEKELFEIKSLLREKGVQGVESTPFSIKSYQRMREEAHAYHPDFPLRHPGYFNQPDAYRPESFKPGEPPGFASFGSHQHFGHGQGQPQQNKWLAKANSSINDTLFEVLSLENPHVQESQLIAFLRTISNLKQFSSIEPTLLDKLLEKIISLIVKNIDNNLILVEYIIKWIEKYVAANKISDIVYAQQLCSVLTFVQNKLDDEIIASKVANLLTQPVFKNLQRNSLEEKFGPTRNSDLKSMSSKMNVENYKNASNQSPKFEQGFNLEELKQEYRLDQESRNLQPLDSQDIDFNARFNVADQDD